jgi:hypothetical protein
MWFKFCCEHTWFKRVERTAVLMSAPCSTQDQLTFDGSLGPACLCIGWRLWPQEVVCRQGHRRSGAHHTRDQPVLEPRDAQREPKHAEGMR